MNQLMYPVNSPVLSSEKIRIFFGEGEAVHSLQSVHTVVLSIQCEENHSSKSYSVIVMLILLIPTQRHSERNRIRRPSDHQFGSYTTKPWEIPGSKGAKLCSYGSTVNSGYSTLSLLGSEAQNPYRLS